MLDQYQKAAVYNGDCNALVVAAPGSGKTTVIVNKVVYLIKEKHVDPENIIVITFTKAAARNMEIRFKSICDSSIPFFGTFHSLFYRLLKENDEKINILSEGESLSIINNVLKNYSSKLSDEKAEQVLGDISVYKMHEENMDNFNPSVDKEVFFKCLEAYEEFKQEKSFIDFDDLQMRFKDFLLKHPSMLKYYREKFKYILVDEFQDCDYTQIQILKLLNRGNYIFAVGDEDQCIYGFRGSRPDCMVHFSEEFVNGQKYFLSVNYRSIANIVELSKELIKYNMRRNQKNIISNKGYIDSPKDKHINFYTCDNDNSEAQKISEIILHKIAGEDFNYGEIAVLYRTYAENSQIINSFVKNKIPFKVYGNYYNPFDNPVYRDLLAYLKFAVNRNDKMCLKLIANKPRRYISRLYINKLMEKNYVFDCLEEIRKNDLSFPVFRSLKEFEYKLNKLKYKLLNKKINLYESVDYICYRLNYFDYLKEYCSKSNQNTEDILQILDDFKELCKNFDCVYDFIDYADNFQADMDKYFKAVEDKQAVTLSTIHGVKGMEFNSVFIINCNEGIIPHEKCKDDNFEEERRLFYVGITRAIEYLYIFHTARIKSKDMLPSRFLKECNLF